MCNTPRCVKLLTMCWTSSRCATHFGGCVDLHHNVSHFRIRGVCHSSYILLGRPYQTIYSETIQSHQEQRLIYTWTLDLLYHTLRKAMKSDELTRALSKPFIPPLAPILFPRGIKRVRKAARAYLENVSRRFLV